MPDSMKDKLVKKQNATNGLAKVTGLKGILSTERIQGKFKEVLGDKAPAFMASILSATNTNPSLAKADPSSVVNAAMIAATLDLPINSSLAFAHIVPYGGVAQFQMGWKGYVQLAIRTGQYTAMNVSEVYEDELDFYNPLTGEFKATDASTWEDRYNGSGKIVGYMAFFKLLNGFEKYFYMTKKQVEIHGKTYSKSYSQANGRWRKDFDSMALKTVIKLLLSKWGILSTEMQRSINADQAVITDIENVDDSNNFDYVDTPNSGSDETIEEKDDNTIDVPFTEIMEGE